MSADTPTQTPAPSNAPTPADALRLSDAQPLTFTIQYPPARRYFSPWRAPDADDADAADVVVWSSEALLYAHVPFCEAKCFYCNFAVDLRRSEEARARYLDALCAQLDALDRRWPTTCAIPGVDVGGGTPTLLSAPQLTRLLRALQPFLARSPHPHPLSIETTPKVAATCPDRLDALRAGGVSRVSMGLQSTHDQTLAAVNRRAQRSLGDAGVAALRAAGFARVNVDLVFGLPAQTPAAWREDLARVASLPIDSVTTYDCLYRGEGRAMPKLTPARPTPDLYGDLYDLAFDALTTHGFHAPYGSLNFSRHPAETGTSPYFEGRLLHGLPYIGAGNYASSLVHDRWWFAPATADAFADAIRSGLTLPASDLYRLPAPERCAKLALAALSFGTLPDATFLRAFGQPLAQLYPAALPFACDQGWLQYDGHTYRVAPHAFRHIHRLRALLYTPSALTWLATQPALT